MAYDEELAERIRAVLASETGLTEQKMFGGLSFMINGTMAVAADWAGGLLMRVGPEAADQLVDGKHIVPAELGGRTMDGWLHVGADEIADDERLASLIGISAAYAAQLPKKSKKKSSGSGGGSW